MPALPVLERANFLAIFASNLDEFFMVRVAGLKRRIITGLAVPTNVGRSPQEVLADISADAHALQLRHADAWTSQVRPALADAGIEVISWDQLEDDERTRVSEYFQAQVFPVLMPLAVDPAHPFPYISGLSLNLAIRIRNAQDRAAGVREAQGAADAARASWMSPATATPCATCRSRSSSRTTSRTCSPAWRSSTTTRSASPATRTS